MNLWQTRCWRSIFNLELWQVFLVHVHYKLSDSTLNKLTFDTLHVHLHHHCRVKLRQTTVQLGKTAMWDIVWVSPQEHRLVSVRCQVFLQAPQCPWPVRKRFRRPLLSWEGETKLPDCGSWLTGFPATDLRDSPPLTLDVGGSHDTPQMRMMVT